jgi:lysophospholipase L1-like esterase
VYDVSVVISQRYAQLSIPAVMNAGVSGNKAENMIARFEKDVLARKPTIVTINVGINDVWHRLAKPHDDAVLATYITNVTAMVTQAQAAGARVILLAPTVIKEDLEQEGNKRLPLYVAALRDIAAAKKCDFVDLYAMFRATLAKKPADLQGNFLTGDGVHMNQRGYAIVALGLLRGLGVPDEVSAATEIPWPPPRMTPADIFAAKTFTAPGETNQVLRYRYGKPTKLETGKRYPLVLCLHGAGERGTDNEKQVGYFRPLLDPIMAATPCYVVIPQVPPNQLWATYGWGTKANAMQEQASPAMALTKQLVDQIVAAEPVDRDRIYLTGLSMGGYGTWEMIQR